MRMAYIVYKITNKVNGKFYIGYTGTTLEERWRQHCYCYHDVLLARAIKKYGEDAFEREVLYEFETDLEAQSTEIYLISKLRANQCRYDNGIAYNMTDGGEGAKGYSPPERIRKHFSKLYKGKGNPFYGRKHTEEAKAAMSAKKKGRPISLGRKLSEETKRKIGYASKLRTQGKDNPNYGNIGGKSPLSKPVQKIDLETNEVLETFPSSLEAAEAVGGSRNSIMRVCRGGRKSHKGFGWRYA